MVVEVYRDKVFKRTAIYNILKKVKDVKNFQLSIEAASASIFTVDLFL